ncbi:unnamed protein product, partial [Phaeothamnion confervicola]
NWRNRRNWQYRRPWRSGGSCRALPVRAARPPRRNQPATLLPPPPSPALHGADRRRRGLPRLCRPPAAAERPPAPLCGRPPHPAAMVPFHGAPSPCLHRHPNASTRYRRPHAG